MLTQAQEVIQESSVATPHNASLRIAVLFVAMVWVPATSMQIAFIVGLKDVWVPVSILTIAMFLVLYKYLFSKLSYKSSLVLCISVISLILLARAIDKFLYDSTGDGRWYHEDAILGVLHGINPVYQEIPANPVVFANHYPKASWYFSAFVIHLVRSYQVGKIYHFILMFGCAAYSWSFFRRTGIGGMPRLLLTVVTALAPVSASQMLSYYVDGALSSLLTMTILSAVSLLYFPQQLDRLLFFLSASLAFGLKFTAVPYIASVAVVILLARITILCRKPKPRPWRVLWGDIGIVMVTVGFGIVVIGFTPYVTNIRSGLHILYPVMGSNKIDVVKAQMPAVLRVRSYNRFEKFFISYFSYTREWVDDRKMGGLAFDKRGLKIPFKVTRSELIAQCAPDIRLAGWGVLMSGITLVAAILFLSAKGWQDRVATLALVLTLTTTFINPECWNARFAPQVALLPIFLLLPALRTTSRFIKGCAHLLGGLLLVNNVLLAGGAIGLAIVKTKRLNEAFTRIAQRGGPGDYWGLKEGSMHLIQFSGLRGIKICGEIPWSPEKLAPSGGFPVGMSLSSGPELILYKGSCHDQPQFNSK